MIKFSSAVLLVLLAGVAVTRAQQSSRSTLSDAEKAGIAEAVFVEIESRNQGSFPFVKQPVSSYNIESLQPSQLSKHGFTLVSARSLNESKKDHMVQYLVFRKIFLRDGVAVVYLSSISEGRPCFANYAFHEFTSIYEARPTPDGWVAESKREQMPFPGFVMTGHAILY
jgi:hypothetical protein